MFIVHMKYKKQVRCEILLVIMQSRTQCQISSPLNFQILVMESGDGAEVFQDVCTWSLNSFILFYPLLLTSLFCSGGRYQTNMHTYKKGFWFTYKSLL